METLIRNVRDLDQSDRSALERLVGHQLRESERLVIQVMSTGVEEPARPADDELPAWSDVYEDAKRLVSDCLEPYRTGCIRCRDAASCVVRLRTRHVFC